MADGLRFSNIFTSLGKFVEPPPLVSRFFFEPFQYPFDVVSLGAALVMLAKDVATGVMYIGEEADVPPVAVLEGVL